MTMTIDSANIAFDESRWAWWDAPNTLTVFMFLLRTAFTEDRPYRELILRRGDVYATLDEITEQTGLSLSVVRTALKHLVMSRDVAFIRCGYHRIIRILSYGNYVKQAPEECGDAAVEAGKEDQEAREAEGPAPAVDSVDRAGEGESMSGNDAEEMPRAESVSDRDSREAGRIPRPREQNKKTAPKGGREGNGMNPADPKLKGFRAFWDAYPRKISKPKAEQAWASLCPDEKTAGEILAAVTRMAGSDLWKLEDGRYVPYPANWLRDRRWEDDPSEARRKIAPPGKNTGSGARFTPTVPAQQYEQRDYSADMETPEEMIARLKRGPSFREK